MITYRSGGKDGKEVTLVEADDLVVVQNRADRPIKSRQLTKTGRGIISNLSKQLAIAEGLEVYSTDEITRDEARSVLKNEENLRFAGRVLTDEKSGEPVVYTDKIFVKFEDDAKQSEIKSTLARHDKYLKILRRLPYAPNCFVLGQSEDIGQRIFEMANDIVNAKPVRLCQPELLRRRLHRGISQNQWHLAPRLINNTMVKAHANVEEAWAYTRGNGTKIAIIDDGVDVRHPEFRRQGKVGPQIDYTTNTPDASPRSDRDNHGTACAGVACADGVDQASGVAPDAMLLPVRLVKPLGSLEEADAFYWAASNGADVISCSWGPPDGDWTDPSDPLHTQDWPIQDSTALAIDSAVEQGRMGRGCVIAWAAGNGNESADLDGWASYPSVISVAACNDRSEKSAYSDFGDSVWCCFPSNHGRPSLTPGIWTTDRRGGKGYNSGNPARGDALGNYTNSFGGTSSACPGVAGVAALMLARNPFLNAGDVKEILKDTADQIDGAGGNYDGSGHSTKYGYGRVNAGAAVEASNQSMV